LYPEVFSRTAARASCANGIHWVKRAEGGLARNAKRARQKQGMHPALRAFLREHRSLDGLSLAKAGAFGKRGAI